MRASDVDKQRRFGKLRATMRRLANISGITFLLFVVWKVALLIFTAQPVPSNDSFFYDGPVVNYLLHGHYCNPSLAMVMPISGQEVFAAYPPLYQGVLLVWMKYFGPSALAAMWLHVGLLSLFALTVLMIFRQLQVPVLAVNLAGLFLFGITFHDRPDTLAHVWGALAVLAVVRGLTWPAAAFLLLTFGTSLQIGAIYSLWAAVLTTGAVWLRPARFPWAEALALAGVIAGLVSLVKFGCPHLWAGFQEHLRITPSITGLRLPSVDDILKVIRTAPGIILVMMALAWQALKGGIHPEHSRRSLPLNRSADLPIGSGLASASDEPIGRSALLSHFMDLAHEPLVGGILPLLVALSGALAAMVLMGGCLFVLTPNTIHVAGYLQPVIVGCFLTIWMSDKATPRWTHLTPFLAAALLVSVRAIGMTTWGLACARDVSYAAARSRVKAELHSTPPTSTLFVSAAFLYDAAQRTNITWLHSDWPASASGLNWERQALESLRPAKLILTQFDYYRRYEPVLADLQQSHPEFGIHIDNLAHLPPPDASPKLRKVVQHISWAPVVVDFTWPKPVK